METAREWAAELEQMHRRIARRFVRPEPRERALSYLKGLTATVERKNGWQLAEAAGEASPDGMQRLLNAAEWDADAVRDDLREYVIEHLGDEEGGVLIVDETGFLKKGEKSVGVARQYTTGTAGKRENAQVGVFVVYASEKGAAFVDRALYLPREWAGDAERRAEVGVPKRQASPLKASWPKRCYVALSTLAFRRDGWWRTRFTRRRGACDGGSKSGDARMCWG